MRRLGVLVVADMTICPKCVKEKRPPPYHGLAVAIDSNGARREDFVNCTHHGDYPLEEAFTLIEQGHRLEFTVDPAQYKTGRSTLDQEASPPDANNEST